MAEFDRQGMMEMFIFEMTQLVDQLETHVVQSESEYSTEAVNEIFRIMHTIKGSAAMMMFDGIAEAAHTMEDLFYYIREQDPSNVNFSELTDHVLEAMDFIKGELSKISDGEESDGDCSVIAQRIRDYLSTLKGEVAPAAGASSAEAAASPESTAVAAGGAGANRFSALIKFEEGCEMENIRSYTLVHNLGGRIFDYNHVPEDIIDEDSIPFIRENGFALEFSTDMTYDEVFEELEKTIYLRELKLKEVLAEEADARPGETYKAVVWFTQGNENDKAYTFVRHLGEKCTGITHTPVDIVSDSACEALQKDGLQVEFTTGLAEQAVNDMLKSFAEVREHKLGATDEVKAPEIAEPKKEAPAVENAAPAQKMITDAVQAEEVPAGGVPAKKTPVQHVISVNVSKLDQLLNLMGELVIAEAMVTQNPELEGLELESFHKETRQLRKIITDVQDTVMSMRMVPLSQTFFKMHRLVRDMCKSLDKDAALEIIGEETEVDKNIIEHIADPLMHIIRNSIDHGIESPEGRKKAGKPSKGTVCLEAKNAGGDVLIIISDDGQGLNKDAIMNKARRNGLLRKSENEYTEKEIHQFIFLPGFSTNEQVTSYSGRGVGMDVVSTNLEEVGGSVLVESSPGEGSVFTLKIPLTLAIIEGMTIKMSGAKYTIPIISIKESFKAKEGQVFVDPSGNEMIQVRGEVYNVVRLNEFFGVDSAVQDVEDGIMIMLENGDQTVCLFADELIGEQQVVVKSMPKYIKKVHGISGCTLLGNGDISLIIDVAGFFDR